MNYKELAKKAHVSESTVSKALSGSRDISTALSDEIFRLALQTGYFEDRRRRKHDVNTERPIIVAILCPEINSPDYSRTVEIFQEKFMQQGIETAVYNYHFNKEKMNQLIKLLLVRNCADGIITFSPVDALFARPPVPIVCLESTGAVCGGYDSVCSDQKAAMLDAVKYLNALGHRRIGFIGENHTPAKESWFQEALEELRLPVEPDQIFRSQKRFEEAGIEGAAHYLKTGDFATAYICAYDEIALGFIHRLTQNGIRIPEDVSVVGFNDIPYAAYAKIPLTTVHFFEESQYDSAIDLLTKKLRNADAPIQHITLEHRIAVRGTTAPPKE